MLLHFTYFIIFPMIQQGNSIQISVEHSAPCYKYAALSSSTMYSPTSTASTTQVYIYKDAQELCMNPNVLIFSFACKQRELLVLVTLPITKARAEHAGSN